MITFKEYLTETVYVNHYSYQGSHNKIPRGKGNWMFGKTSNIDFSKHKSGEDYFSYNGLYTEAKKAAVKWAKEKGHFSIHVLP